MHMMSLLLAIYIVLKARHTHECNWPYLPWVALIFISLGQLLLSTSPDTSLSTHNSQHSLLCYALLAGCAASSSLRPLSAM